MYEKAFHVRLLQPLRVNFMLAGLSDDASRFRIVNEIRRSLDRLEKFEVLESSVRRAAGKAEA